MTKIDQLVNRFLAWPVPADVHPDGTPGQPGRTGTNLLTSDQAKQMLEHVLGDALSQTAVFDAIASEREYQDRKWGTPAEHPHEVGGWLTLMAVHLRRAQDAWAGANSDTEALEALRKVLAVGVACAEQHGIRGRSRSQPVSERMRADGFHRASGYVGLQDNSAGQ